MRNQQTSRLSHRSIYSLLGVLRKVGGALALLVGGLLLYPVFRAFRGSVSRERKQATKEQVFLPEAELEEPNVLATEVRRSRWGGRVVRLAIVLLIFGLMPPLGLVAPPQAEGQAETYSVEVEVAPTGLKVSNTYIVTATITDLNPLLPSEGSVVTWQRALIAGPNAGEPQFSNATSVVQAGPPEDGFATTTVHSKNAGSSELNAIIEDAVGTMYSASDPPSASWIPDVAFGIVLNPTNDTNPAGTTHTVISAVVDQFGNTVTSKHNIAFIKVSGPGTPNFLNVPAAPGGVAAFSFSSNQAGTTVIQAQTNIGGQKIATASKVWHHAVPTITVSPETDTNPVGTDHVVIAMVTDEFGNPVDNHSLTFRATGPHPTLTVNGTSDAGGKATFTISGVTKVGTSFITVTASSVGDIEGSSGTAVGYATKNWHHGAPAGASLLPSVGQNTTEQQHPMTFTVVDASGNPIASHPVTVTVEGAGGKTITGTTNPSGVFTFVLTSTVPGQAKITAVVVSDGSHGGGVGSAFATATKDWVVGPPRRIQIDPEFDTNPAGSVHTIVATVVDEFGNPVEDEDVLFDFVEPSTGDEQNLSGFLQFTDASGRATFTFTSFKTGTSTVQADSCTVFEGCVATATKIWIAATPTMLTAEPPSAVNDVGEVHTMTAKATDTFGNPIGGQVVTMTVVGPHGLAITATATTNVDGVATFSFTSFTPGTSFITFTLTSNIEGASGTLVTSAVKTWNPYQVTVTPVEAFNPVGTSHTLTATVTNIDGDPAPDGTPVVFQVMGPGATEAVVSTIGGVATFTFYSEQSGVSHIWVFVGEAFDERRLVNDGFETGDTSGWDMMAAGPGGSISPSDGTFSVVTDHTSESFTTYFPVEGRFFLLLEAGVVDTPTKAEQEIFLPAGETIHGFAAFDCGDPDLGFEDFAAVTILGPGGPAGTPFFEDCSTVGVLGDGAWTFWSFTAASSATYTVKYESVNIGDSEYPSFGLFDAARISAHATKTWFAGSPFTYTLEPQLATNAVGTTHTVTLTFVDEFGNTTPGVNGCCAEFEVAGTGGEDPTSGSPEVIGGVATFSFTSTLAGRSIITANVEGPDITATKDWVESDPTSLDLDPPSATNQAGQTHVVTATVRDQVGGGFAGVTVTISVAGTGAEAPTSVTAATDQDGRVTFAFTSTQTGQSIITATAAGLTLTVTATKNWTPALGNITLDPTGVINVVGETHTVTATVTDEFGNPVPGEPISFEAAGTAQEAPPGSCCPLTDANGQATFQFTSTRTGVSTITATIFDDGGRNAVATKTWVAGPAKNIMLTPESATNTVGETHTVTAMVTDEFGNPVQTDVAFCFQQTCEGFATGSSTGAEQPDFDIRSTDANGKVSFSFTSTKTGTSNLFGFARDTSDFECEAFILTSCPSDVVTKTWLVGEPALRLDPKEDVNVIGQTHTVTATLSDDFDNPISGRDIGFEAQGTGVESPNTGGSITDANGQVTFSFTSTQTGQSVITATLENDNGLFATATKNWITGSPDTITLTPTNVTNTVGEKHTVTVEVRDEFNNPVPDGTTVSFQAAGTSSEDPSGGVAVLIGGQANFSFTATKTGVSVITATSGGISATATKTWIAGPPDHLIVNPPIDTNVINTQHGVFAAVFDEFDNAVADGTQVGFVAFGTGKETPNSGADTTSGGIAAFQFTSSKIGTSTIIAVTENDKQGSATKVWVCPQRITSEITPYPGFRNGVFVAGGDLDGDGCDEIITGAGQGGGPHVRYFNGRTGAPIDGGGFMAYASSFRGGVRVGAGDVDGDGKDEIIVSPGPGFSSPDVRIYDVDPRATFKSSFVPYPGFVGGVFVAGGDVNGDGRDDIITGPDEGGGPHVKVRSGLNGATLESFFAYVSSFRGGVRVGAADTDGDGDAEVLTAPGPGGGPHVKVWERTNSMKVIAEFMAYTNPKLHIGGVFIAGGDVVPGNAGDEYIVGADSGRGPKNSGGPHLKVYKRLKSLIREVMTFDPSYRGGIRVGAADVDGDGNGEELVARGPDGIYGVTTVRIFE